MRGSSGGQELPQGDVYPCISVSIQAAQLWQDLANAPLYVGRCRQWGLGIQQGLGEPLQLLCVAVRAMWD